MFPLNLRKSFTLCIQNAHFNFLKAWLLRPHKSHIQKYNKFQQNHQAEQGRNVQHAGRDPWSWEPPLLNSSLEIFPNWKRSCSATEAFLCNTYQWADSEWLLHVVVCLKSKEIALFLQSLHLTEKGSINPELSICHQSSQGLIAQGKLEYRYVDCGRVLEKISHSD